MPAECLEYGIDMIYDLPTAVTVTDLCLTLCDSLFTALWPLHTHFGLSAEIWHFSMVGSLGIWGASKFSLGRGDLDKAISATYLLDASHHLEGLSQNLHCSVGREMEPSSGSKPILFHWLGCLATDSSLLEACFALPPCPTLSPPPQENKN